MSFIINPFVFALAGSPSTSEIRLLADADVEAAVNEIIAGTTTLTSGVTGANGRVYDGATNQNSIGALTAERFVSLGMRVRFRVDGATGTFMSIRRESAQAIHIDLNRIQTSGFLRVEHGDNTVLATGAVAMALDTWYYVMLYGDIDDVGAFTAKLFDASGVLLETLSGTSVDTYNGTATAERFHWGAPAMDTYHDEIWLDINGAFRGCGRIEDLSPTGAGATAAWSRGGTDTGANWDQVNELPKDTTSYIFSTAADQVDTYAFANRSIVGTPIGIQTVVYARAHTAGTRDFKHVCRIGGVDYLSTTTFSVTSTSSDSAQLYRWDNNPATGNAWTDSDIDSAEFGVKSVTTDVRVQTVAAMVLVSI